MKQLFALFSLLLIISGCTVLEDLRSIQSDSFVDAPITKGSQFSGSSTDYQVSLNDVQSYVKWRNLLAENEESCSRVAEVISITEDSLTVAYAVCFERGGWELISADKRAPLILATCEKGTFVKEDIPEAARIWLGQCTFSIRELLGGEMIDENKLSDEEISNNLLFWDLVSARGSLIEDHLNTTKSQGLTPTEPGHWELVDTQVSYNVPLFFQDHLMNTHWDQQYPYNAYCPLQSNQNSRVPAGCVAVAGGQLLYYFHGKYGVPQMSPTYGSVSGYIGHFNHDTDQQFGSFTSMAWEQMTSDSSLIAKLLGWIGKRVRMEYGDDVSYSHNVTLVDSVFVSVGLSCSYQNFSSSVAKEEIAIYSRPILMGAYSSVNYIFGLPVYSGGHSFVMDGYRETATQYVYTYEWVYDGDPEDEQNFTLPRVEVEYSAPTKFVKMNWGYGAAQDEVWYYPDGDWICGGANFQFQRMMHYCFVPQI